MSETKIADIISTHILCSMFFFPANHAAYGIIW